MNQNLKRLTVDKLRFKHTCIKVLKDFGIDGQPKELSAFEKFKLTPQYKELQAKLMRERQINSNLSAAESVQAQRSYDGQGTVLEGANSNFDPLLSNAQMPSYEMPGDVSNFNN